MIQANSSLSGSQGPGDIMIPSGSSSSASLAVFYHFEQLVHQHLTDPKNATGYK